MAQPLEVYRMQMKVCMAMVGHGAPEGMWGPTSPHANASRDIPLEGHLPHGKSLI